MREVASELNSSWRALRVPSPTANRNLSAPLDPARVATKRHRKPPRHVLLTLTGICTAGLAAFGTVAVLAPERLEPLGLPGADRLAVMAGFGIDQVSVTGHRFTPDADIFDALDLANSRSLVAFDTAAVRARFERLAWVRSAEISRIWPGELAVRVTERTPYAVWQRGEAEFLIDATGRVLSPIKREAGLALPRVAGEGAAAEAQAFLTLLGRYEAVAKRVVFAERVAERRWSLHLNNGTVLHLPSDREATALDTFVTSAAFGQMTSGPARIIDLRAPGRVAVRPIQATAAGAAAPPAHPQM